MVSASTWFRFSTLFAQTFSDNAIGIYTTWPNAWISWPFCRVIGVALVVPLLLRLFIFIISNLSHLWQPAMAIAASLCRGLLTPGPCLTCRRVILLLILFLIMILIGHDAVIPRIARRDGGAFFTSRSRQL